ncbi:hypothetical protein I7I48_09337 [Histoplasma ohiense]|nr:hypothetical protein I7I48_09337 [Histoplasma ohiense (nom. inval.)]
MNCIFGGGLGGAFDLQICTVLALIIPGNTSNYGSNAMPNLAMIGHGLDCKVMQARCLSRPKRHTLASQVPRID